MRATARGPIAALSTSTLTPLTARRAGCTLRARRTIFAPLLPLTLRALTLRTTFRPGSRLLRRFRRHRRRLDRFGSRHRRWSFGRGRLRRGRFRRHNHIRLHIIRHSVNPLRFG